MKPTSWRQRTGREAGIGAILTKGIASVLKQAKIRDKKGRLPFFVRALRERRGRVPSLLRAKAGPSPLIYAGDGNEYSPSGILKVPNLVFAFQE